MFGILLIAVMWLVCANSQPTKEGCESLEYISSLCDDISETKLGVSFQGKSVKCGQLLKKSTTRLAPVVTYKEAKKEGETYVFIMSDPDAPYYCAPRSNADWIHYIGIVISKKNGLLSNKIDIIPYTGPSPPIGEHRYQMYLYKWSKYDSSTPRLANTAKHRAFFSRGMFVNNNNLGNNIAFFQFRVTANESGIDFDPKDGNEIDLDPDDGNQGRKTNNQVTDTTHVDTSSNGNYTISGSRGNRTISGSRGNRTRSGIHGNRTTSGTRSLPAIPLFSWVCIIGYVLLS